MRVLDIINRDEPSKVAVEYRRAYVDGDDRPDQQAGWASIDAFEKFRAIVNGAVGIQTPMRVVVQLRRDDGQDWYDVSGLEPGNESSWALEFRPWGEWKLMEVEHPDSLDIHQVACHLYYEMTWCGWPEQIEARFDYIMDLKEEVERDLGA